MVPKIPVAPRQVFYIWAQTNQTAVRFETTRRLAQSAPQTFLRRKVLKKIAGEDDVQMCVLQIPPRRAVLRKKGHVLGKLAGGRRIQIHSIFPLRRDLVDEFPPAAA